MSQHLPQDFAPNHPMPLSNKMPFPLGDSPPPALENQTLLDEERKQLHQQHRQELVILAQEQLKELKELHERQVRDLSDLHRLQNDQLELHHHQQQERQTNQHLAQNQQLQYRSKYRDGQQNPNQLQASRNDSMMAAIEEGRRLHELLEQSVIDDEGEEEERYLAASQAGEDTDQMLQEIAKLKNTFYAVLRDYGVKEGGQDAVNGKERFETQPFHEYEEAGPFSYPRSHTHTSERVKAGAAAKKGRKNTRKPGDQRVCVNCGATETPMWRTNAMKRPLCNACGVYSRQNNTERPLESTENGMVIKKKQRPQKVENKDLLCSNCGTHSTPTWRKGPGGETLCNACGLHVRLYQNQRPKSLKSETFKKRVSKPANDKAHEEDGVSLGMNPSVNSGTHPDAAAQNLTTDDSPSQFLYGDFF